MSDVAALAKQAEEAVKALREMKEKHGAESHEFKTAIEKTDKTLADYDKKNSDLMLKINEAKNASEDQARRIQEMEVAMARGTSGDKKSWKSTAEFKAVDAYLRTGIEAEIKALRADASTDGGYLVPHEMANDIIKEIIEISPIRALARVVTIGKKTIEMPKRTTVPAAEYEGELEQSPLSQSVYANETLTAHRLAVTIQVTKDLLMDAGYDIESEVNSDVALAFALREGRAFVTGTGIKQPEGFLTNAANVANAKNTAASGLLKADDLLLLTGELKTGYDPTFVFNRTTLALIRTLKGTTNDHYLWQAGLAPDAPATIGGDPYVVVPDMPNVAAGALAVAYGDFRRGYRIVDRTGMTMIRDEYTNARSAQVNMTFARWNHGQVVLSEAFKLLRIAP